MTRGIIGPSGPAFRRCAPSGRPLRPDDSAIMPSPSAFGLNLSKGLPNRCTVGSKWDHWRVFYDHDSQMSCSSQLESENNKKGKNCLNQSFGFILPKGRLTVVLLAQSGVTGGFCVTI